MANRRLPSLETLFRRDRRVVAVGLGLVVALAWVWTLGGAGLRADSAASGGAAATLLTPAAWSAGHALLVFAMWWVMMVAMMLPSAAPFVLLATTIHRRKAEQDDPGIAAALLTAGYLLVWGFFSLVATGAQWGLESTGLLASGTGFVAGPVLAGGLLVAAGAYQLTPLKRACLRSCRSPMEFLVRHWSPGPAGTLRMGLAHGAYCVGCCWFLMGLLFVGGVMNPLWIGGIALYVFVEKLAPWGRLVSRAAGLLLVLAGTWLWLDAV